MGKVIDTTYNPTSYELLTQTPKNLVKDNYYREVLQEKINADWEYRPNRVDVEQEKTIGEEDYFPLEVVIQNVRSDKGEKVSDDIKRLVFKDINYKVRLGSKFRFSFNFDLEEPNIDKFVWLTTNKDSTIPTAGVVVSRCNGTLGSIYKDNEGNFSYHYEPVICTTDLKSVGFKWSNTIVTPNGTVMLIVQHNKYTQQYYINQRFVLGYNKVYKVTNINSFNSLKTYDPYDVDTLLIYAEMDQISPKDNFKTRIAFNIEGEHVDTNVSQQPSMNNIHLELVSPDTIPQYLYSAPVRFQVQAMSECNALALPIQVQATLENASNPETYFELTEISSGIIEVKRKKLYNRSPLEIKFFIPSEESPTGEEISLVVSMSLRGLE